MHAVLGTLTSAVASRAPLGRGKTRPETARLVVFCSTTTVVWVAVLFQRGTNSVVSRSRMS